MYKATPLHSNYDSFNSEITNLLTPNFFTGLRTHISKSINNHLQFSSTTHFHSNSPVLQKFVTFSTKNSIFQFSFNQNRNYQFKASVLYGLLLNKIHIIKNNTEIFSQIETLLNSRFFNVGFKLINSMNNLIYIVNWYNSMGDIGPGHIECGIEAVGIENELGISLVTRIEDRNGIVNMSIQRFNTITVSVYRYIMGFMEVGVEVKKRGEKYSCLCGMRVENGKSEIKLNLDSSFKINYEWNENITENLRVEFYMGIDEEIEYGLGMNYEC